MEKKSPWKSLEEVSSAVHHHSSGTFQAISISSSSLIVSSFLSTTHLQEALIFLHIHFLCDVPSHDSLEQVFPISSEKVNRKSVPHHSVITAMVATGHVEGSQYCPLAAAESVFPWDISQVWSDALQDFSTSTHCRQRGL